VILNLAVALTAGLLAGRLVDAIGDHPASWTARAVGWTGIFKPPTAWDYFWLYAATGAWAAVEIELTGGKTVNVLFDSGSDVGLSPNPRQAFFDTEYLVEDDGELQVLQHSGIFIDCGEVVALRLEHLEVVPDVSAASE
jgi:hypothetical protein